MNDNEDFDPVGSSNPIEVFTALALQASLVAPGESLSPAMLAFATLIVDRCAAIADGFGDEALGGNAGEQIRAELYG